MGESLLYFDNGVLGVDFIGHYLQGKGAPTGDINSESSISLSIATRELGIQLDKSRVGGAEFTVYVVLDDSTVDVFFCLGDETD